MSLRGFRSSSTKIWSKSTDLDQNGGNVYEIKMHVFVRLMSSYVINWFVLLCLQIFFGTYRKLGGFLKIILRCFCCFCCIWLFGFIFLVCCYFL